MTKEVGKVSEKSSVGNVPFCFLERVGHMACFKGIKQQFVLLCPACLSVVVSKTSSYRVRILLRSQIPEILLSCRRPQE